MIVTDTTLVGFTMINGTWGVQTALLIASLFNYFINPAPEIPQDQGITNDEYQTELSELYVTRAILIPGVHACLAVICFMQSSDRIPYDGLKQGLSFLGMVLYTGMILTASQAMIYYHYPLEEGQTDTL